ncbi:REP-associated tyrosine transposase [Reyranella sp.]|uniref:REP-associated tyrosine transposase n=1 Tax=Reyranella sp. TaxID=1929291 RepID=UPI003BAB1D93
MSHKGWHSRGYLPHFDSAETTQFVTFRLADSLPKAVAAALALLPDSLVEIDRALDSGRGACWLAQPAIASTVEDAILHFDGERYRLLAWCIMPNHVHVVVEPAPGHSLGSIVRSWKSFTANGGNRLLGRDGPFWHRDYFDRFIRDEGHLARTIDYVENNPVKAGLVPEPAGWRWSSARLRG